MEFVMCIKSILCIFNGAQEELGAVRAAFDLGKLNCARVCFLHISPDFNSYISFYDGDLLVSASIVEAITKDNAARFEQAKQYITSLAAKYHVPLDGAGLPVHHASAKFVHLTGNVDEIITREGRLCDLIIMGRGGASANALYDSALVSALFGTGRPVMLLPESLEQGEGGGYLDFKTVALAWKGSLEAGRAVYSSMPFLEKAEKVYALTVEGQGETQGLKEESALMEYLRTHGINATGIMVAAGNDELAEALLHRAEELKVDLLVMGAYGHSRFREMMFGGVTNYMLEKANIPLLLSH
jgi:nucleotide-binding universal stress UspA family protein